MQLDTAAGLLRRTNFKTPPQKITKDFKNKERRLFSPIAASYGKATLKNRLMATGLHKGSAFSSTVILKVSFK